VETDPPTEAEEKPMSQLTLDIETAALLSTLTAQRDHVLGTLAGLDDEASRRAVLPSGWTCLGLVQHLTLDVERFWFGCVVGGEQAAIDDLTGSTDAWHVDAEVPASAVFAAYREAIVDADAIITRTPLDAAPAWWPDDLFGSWRPHDLREIMLHVITETACHAGHLDAARELIDGSRWLVLTD
jgi:hypothetical protein